VKNKELEILGDSQLVIRQLTGVYKVRSQRTAPLHRRVTSLLEGLKWTAEWIPREENTVADELCNRSYREHWTEKQGHVPPTMRQSGAIE